MIKKYNLIRFFAVFLLVLLMAQLTPVEMKAAITENQTVFSFLEGNKESFESTNSGGWWHKGVKNYYQMPGGGTVTLEVVIPKSGYYIVSAAGYDTGDRYTLTVDGETVWDNKVYGLSGKYYRGKRIGEMLYMEKGASGITYKVSGSGCIESLTFTLHSGAQNVLCGEENYPDDLVLTKTDGVQIAEIADGYTAPCWCKQFNKWLYPGAHNKVSFSVDIPQSSYYRVLAGGLDVGGLNTITIDETIIMSNTKWGYISGAPAKFDSYVVKDELYLAKGTYIVTWNTTGADRFSHLSFIDLGYSDDIYIEDFALKKENGDELVTLNDGIIRAESTIIKQNAIDSSPTLIVASYSEQALVGIATATFKDSNGSDLTLDTEYGTSLTASACLDIGENVEYVKAFLLCLDGNNMLMPLKQALVVMRNGEACKIEGESFDLASQDGVSIETSGRDTVVRIKDGAFAEYSFNVLENGVYSLCLATETDGKMKLFFDDSQGFVESNFVGFMNSSGGKYYLSEGTHKLKIEALDTLSLDNFTFYYSNGDYIDLDDLKEGGTFVIESEVEMEAPVYKEFWVSPEGDDLNTGTAESPFATIKGAKDAVQKLSSQMTGDIIVNIASGRYVIDETISFSDEDSGKNGHKVIYKGVQSDDKPIIDGGVKIEGWQEEENGIWSAPLDLEEVRNLYVNGYSAQRARSSFQFDAVMPYDNPLTEEEYDGYYVSKHGFPHFEDISGLEAVQVYRWVTTRIPVKSITDNGDDKFVVAFEQPYYKYLSLQTSAENTAPHTFTNFYLENASELLDEYGEFYYNKEEKKVYYKPFKEENMNVAEIYAAKTETLLSVAGKNSANRAQNIVFENIDFRHGAWNKVSKTGIRSNQADEIFPTCDYNAVPNDLPYLETMHAQVQVKKADEIDFVNCNFSNLGSAAISMSDDVHNCDISGNIFKDISGTAVIVGNGHFPVGSVYSGEVSSRINIDNNVIRRIGLEYHFCPAVGVYYANSISVTNNDISMIPYTGISVGWGWDSDNNSRDLKCSNHKITGNKITYNSQVLRDGGGIYTLGQMNDTEIAYNYLANSPDFGGIYHDSGSRNIHNHHNVISNSRFAVFAGTHITELHDIYADFEDKTFGAVKGYAGSAENWKTVELEGWSNEAEAIISSAGLKEGYTHLSQNAMYPEWRTNFLSASRMPKYSGKDGIYIDSTEYSKFLEKNSSVPTLYYATQDGTVIGGITKNEWVEYDITAQMGGTWKVDMMYRLDTNDTQGAINVYVDGEKLIEGFVIPVMHEEMFTRCDIGTLNLSEGAHKIRFEFTDDDESTNLSILNIDDFKLSFVTESDK